MSWTPQPGSFGFADPLFLLLIALAVEAYLGSRTLLAGRVPHPRAFLSRLVGALERRLNRAARGASVLRVRGFLVACGTLLGAAAAGGLLMAVTRFYPFAWVIEVLLLVILIGQRESWQRARGVESALAGGSLVRAREALRLLAMGRLAESRLERLDVQAIRAATVPALADRYAEGVVAPVFWYLLLGLPGIFVQQAVNVAAMRLGRGRSASDSGVFARPLVSLDRVLTFVPDRLAGLLLAAAALFLPAARPGPAFRRLPGSLAWPRAAMTAALGLVAARPEDFAAPDEALSERTRRLFVAACLLNAALVALVLLVRLGL